MLRESFIQKLGNLETKHADILSIATQFLHTSAAPDSAFPGYRFMGRHAGRWFAYFNGVSQRKQD
jgi:hypothetical protein